MHKLFSSELKVINIGLSAFKKALDDAHAPAVQLDWRPPVKVDAALMKRVRSMLPEIEKANAKAVEIIQAGMPHLVGMGRALDVIPGMKPDLLLHAGPPIDCRMRLAAVLSLQSIAAAQRSPTLMPPSATCALATGA